MPSHRIEYQLRIRNAADNADALVITSVRGGTNPYLSSAPRGDGASFDPLTSESMLGAYTGRIGDWSIGGAQRFVTSQLEDANGRQQLGYRKAYLEYQIDGAGFTGNVLIAGYLTLLRLVSASEFEYTISDPMSAQIVSQLFSPTSSTNITDFLAAWPNRGCILGGPIMAPAVTGKAAKVLGIQDLGGWTMRVETSGIAGEYYLRPVTVYGPPYWSSEAQISQDLADTLNQAVAQMQTAFGNGAESPWTTIKDAQTNYWAWPGITVLIDQHDGHGFQPWKPLAYIYSALADAAGNLKPVPLVSPVKGSTGSGLHVKSDGTRTLTNGTIVRVRVITVLPSETSPIYVVGHPIDVLTSFWTAANLSYDATACTALKTAMGNVQIAFRITEPKSLADLVRAVCSPFGLGIRGNSSGQLQPFQGRAVGATAPTTTITDADVIEGSTGLPFELDPGKAVQTITLSQKIFSDQRNVPYGAKGSIVDGVVPVDDQATFVNGDTTAVPFGQFDLSTEAQVFFQNATTPTLAAFGTQIAQAIFDRFGHGAIALETTLIRGGVGDTIQLGDEVLVQLKQLPNENYRLGDNNAIAARAMQVVRRTVTPSGYEVRLVDSGPNAQPLGTVPVVTIAASTDAPRTVATFTITNAAALNALGYGARLQWAMTTDGTAPAASAYTDVQAWRAGQIPTTAQRLPAAVAGATVYVRARSEGVSTSRPSNYGTAVGVTLSGVADPTGLTATPNVTDGSQCALAWTPGVGTTADFVDVWLRANGDPFSAAIKQIALNPGSTQFTLEHLTPNAAYTASVQYRDPRTNDVSDVIDVSFTTSASTVTLDPPKDPTGFSGSQDQQLGIPRLDGVYGLAVAAAEFPSDVEFTEEVETAPNSGIYGSPTTVGRVGAVQGDWTIWQSIAPNDGLRRQLSARHVRDGATASAYTTGVVVTPWTSEPLGKFTEVAGEDDILRVSATESTDGTARDFKVVVGALVDTIHVHFRTVTIDVVGDPFDFSESADIASQDSGSPMILRAPSDGSGVITFSIAHPVRGFRVAGRIIPHGAPPALKEGPSWPFDVEAAPPAVNAKLHPSRPTSTTADLSIDIAFAVSDGPVTVDVFEDAASGTTTLLTKAMSAGATIDKTSDPALGGRPLPSGKDSLSWRVRITDVSGQAWWFGPASANRDPLPNGNVTLGNYRANPAIVCAFDPDTDSIKVTTHSGKTKTWDAAALALAGSPVTYTVGDTLDDSTTETALVVDETRSGYKVEYEGGSTWVQIGPGITLHGQPSNPPTAKVELLPDSETSTESVKITPDTQVDEELLVFYRQGDTDTTPQWRLCASAIDSSARSVVAGTVIGSADYFVQLDGGGNPTGSPQTILNAIALTRDQITRHGTMIQGKDSGIQSPWIPVVLSLLAQPWLESISAEFDAATHTLLVRVKGGAHCASVFVEASAASNFSAPLTGSSACADGADVTISFVLSAAQLGKTWYVGGTPFNQASLGGLMGVRQVAQVAVPGIFDVAATTSEASGQGTVTLTVTDSGSYFDPTWTNGSITTAISWEIIKLGVKTVEDCTTKPGAGTSGTYTKTVTFDALHMTQVNAYAHLIDGSTAPLGSWGFDSNKISDALAGPSVANNGVTATVTETLDSDTLIGANCARYSLDAGVTWTLVTVSAAYLVQFNVTRLATKQTVLIQGKNALDGAWGSTATTEIDAYLSEGPIFSVQLLANTPDATHDRILWSCAAGTALVSIDGGTFSTPGASPIDVAKPATGRHTYVFQFTNGGVTVTDEVDVLPVSADTITPNLDVALGTPTATTQPVTVTAANPVSGGATPTITVKCVGCTMTISGVTSPDGTTVTVSSGTVVTGNRASNTTATMGQLECVATLGAATERIVVPVPPQTSFGPIYSVQVLANTPDAAHDRIVWSCSQGTATVSIDGGSYGTPAASPIDVAKPVTGRHTYVFKFVAGGLTVTDEVDVLPVSADTVTPNLDVALGTPTATTMPYTATATNPVSGGSAPLITAKCVGCTMTIGGTTYPDGTTQTITSGTVVTGNRASTTTTTDGNIEFVATLGTATERIIEPVPPQKALGPTITATFKQLTSTTGQIIWSCSAGTALLSIDNGTAATPSASPIAITLDGNNHTYLFTATADGQTNAAPVAVPALGASGNGTLLAGTYGACTNSIHAYGNPGTVDFTWASTGFDASVKFNVYVSDPGRYGDSLYHNFATTAAAASSYTYTAGESLSTSLTPTVDIGFFVEATVNDTNGPRSTPVVTTYGSP